MTPEELDAIEARAKAATEGPWTVDMRLGDGTPESPDCECVIVPAGWYVASTENSGNRADAAFIAHARQDVPALVAYVRELERERERLRAALLPLVDYASSMVASRGWGPIDAIVSANKALIGDPDAP